MRLPLSSFLAIGLLSCFDDKPSDDDTGGGGDGGVDCTTEARASVQVTLLNEDGEAIPDAVLTWTTTTGGGTCEDITGSGDWVCGWEVAGEINIQAEAPGYEDGGTTVTVPAGECHVETVSTTLVLSYRDCTDVELPAVTLSVLAEDGSLVPEAVGYFVPSDEDWSTPGVCEQGFDGYMSCAFELSGDIDVWVEATGYFNWSETISVGHDGCHPITEHRDVSLIPQ